MAIYRKYDTTEGGPLDPQAPVRDETIEGATILSDFQRGPIRVEYQAIRVTEHTS